MSRATEKIPAWPPRLSGHPKELGHRWIARIGIITVLALCAWPAMPAPGIVEVHVGNVRDGRGHVIVAVCTGPEFLREHCTYNGSVPARPGSVVVRITGVPPGIYAVQAWHDEDDNGKINRDFLGIPREGVGFSRDAPIRFGPPSFEDAKFEVGQEGGRTTLTLRYFKG